MENQHKKITGYRDLTQEEIDSMNEIKAIGIKLGELVEKLESIENIDKRWLDAGKLDLQMGIMAIVRSVARPTVF
jgi:hypothetical protein